MDIAKGVASLHSHKITHRDLKSPNILLTTVGTLSASGSEGESMGALVTRQH